MSCTYCTKGTNVCVFEFLVSTLVKVWNTEGEKEREKSLFSALGLVVVVELFMRLCDTTLAALGHRGNNKRVLNFGARAGNDCFITRFGQLTACWRCCGGNSWAFECQSQWHQVDLRKHNVANVAHGIVKSFMRCHQDHDASWPHVSSLKRRAPSCKCSTSTSLP